MHTVVKSFLLILENLEFISVIANPVSYQGSQVFSKVGMVEMHEPLGLVCVQGQNNCTLSH